MKISLVFMPAWLPFAPPLGISMIATHIRKNFSDVLLVDGNGEIWNKKKESMPHLWQMDYGSRWTNFLDYQRFIHPHIKSELILFAKKLAFSNRDAIGFSIYSSNYYPSRYVMKLIRELSPNTKIFVGGPSINEKLASECLVEKLFDAAIVGEGEDSALRLLSYWSGGEDISHLRSTYTYDQDGKLFISPKNSLIKLSTTEPPSFHGFNFNHYLRRSLPIEFSRGCVASCSYCSETNYWVSFRTKTVDQLINEFIKAKEECGISEFRVVDSLMNGNVKLLENLCDKIIEKNIKVSWYGFCRADKKLSRELLVRMHAAGCTSVTFGLESGSQKVLDLMNKNVRLETMYRNVKDAHEVGIIPCTQILVGFPGENIIDLGKTFLMLFRMRNQLGSVTTGQSLMVVENSELIENPKKFKIKSGKGEDWYSDSRLNNYYTRKIVLWTTNKWVSFLRLPAGYAKILE